MRKVRWVLALMVIGPLVGMSGCAEMAGTSPQRMIGQSDHVGLANYYAQQAQDLKEKAKHWEFMAEFYEQHPEPQLKDDAAKHAAHCRTIAQNYKKAADEAEVLAQEHRAMRPHGMIQ